VTEPVEFLDLDDLIELARLLLGDPPPIPDVGLLGSAAGRAGQVDAPARLVGGEGVRIALHARTDGLLVMARDAPVRSAPTQPPVTS
jgi:hypothetical protein